MECPTNLTLSVKCGTTPALFHERQQRLRLPLSGAQTIHSRRADLSDARGV